MKIIVARGKNGGIGKNGKLLFHIKEDMEFFQMMTMGKIVIMGRKTFESIGKPLRNRRNIVLSTTIDKSEGYEVCRSVEELLDLLSYQEQKDAFVIGGESIYKLLLPHVDVVYVTEIDQTVPAADTFFDLDCDGEVLFGGDGFKVKRCVL
jgi:dihydrofolate reductase